MASDVEELAEAVLADHPFDAGEAMTAALRDSPLNDIHPVFDWAAWNIPPTERNRRASDEAGVDPRGVPPWIVPEGRSWNNVRGRRNQHDGWTR